MACEFDDFDQNIENLRAIVRKSFARIYATLKARELKTLRQLDAIRKQCQDDKDLKRNCVQNIEINYENEPVLLENINKYGVIDFEKFNFDSNAFTLEDYVSPDDDHMYLYKTIDDLTKKENIDDLEAIEEAALKEVTSTDNCVCVVNIHTEDVSKKFRNLDNNTTNTPAMNSSSDKVIDSNLSSDKEGDVQEEESCIPEHEINNCVDSETKKINPTDDWLNSIKNQTETEPTQITDVMEHSTITCS